MSTRSKFTAGILDFIENASHERVASMAPVRTQPGHLAGTSGGPLQPAVEKQAHGPDGNGVELDAQLTKVADTETTQSLVTSIYKKYMSLFSLALGHSS